MLKISLKSVDIETNEQQSSKNIKILMIYIKILYKTTICIVLNCFIKLYLCSLLLYMNYK